MNNPKELKYQKSHEWLKMEGDVAVIGITDFAQDALGDVVFIELPDVDDEIKAGDTFSDVESVKATSELISPVSGVIVEVNEALDDTPELINDDPYSAWIIKVGSVSETSNELLSAEEYETFCEEEE